MFLSHIDAFSLSPSLPLSLKSISVSLGENFFKKLLNIYWGWGIVCVNPLTGAVDLVRRETGEFTF